MKINAQIDKVIARLQALEPSGNNNISETKKKFYEILTEALETNKSDPTQQSQSKAAKSLDWVDKDYYFDATNARKPNLREFMEAISGRTVEEMYKDINSDWQKLSKKASDVLYGVVSNDDTRDWSKIMSSPDIMKSAIQKQ